MLGYARNTFYWDKYYPLWQRLYDPMLFGVEEKRGAELDLADINHDRAASPENKKTILILYFTRGVFPLRSTIHSHLYCWGKYSKHRIVYVNVALGFSESLIRRFQVDVIIFHTMFLSMRWTSGIFKRNASKCSYLKTLTCTKIIIPQDEFLHTKILNDFCNEFGVTHILTNAKEKDWSNIYCSIDRGQVKLKTVLTGYLDPETLTKIEKLKAKHKPKDIDIGYRAWRAEFWLGEHGTHKTRVAAAFKAAAERVGLNTDISLEEKDVISGDAWFDYLLRCRTTIGVEGGASVLDREGLIKERVAAFLKSNPNATFEDTRTHCFPNEDHKLDLACISPRHLEACATETLQFLVEGTYNDILIPSRHYIPIKKDYSNVDEALKIFLEPARMRKMASTTFEEIVASGRWTYPVFVRDIETSIIDLAPPVTSANHALIQYAARLALTLNDVLNWGFIRIERRCVKSVLKTKAGRWLYTQLIRLKRSY